MYEDTIIWLKDLYLWGNVLRIFWVLVGYNIKLHNFNPNSDNMLNIRHGSKIVVIIKFNSVLTKLVKFVIIL